MQMAQNQLISATKAQPGNWYYRLQDASDSYHDDAKMSGH
jgi:hypothetical protein